METGYFCILAIVNSADMNFWWHVSLWITIFVFFRYISRYSLAGSQFPNQRLNPGPAQWKCCVLTFGPPGIPCFSFLRILRIVFCSGYTILHSHHSVGGFPFLHTSRICYSCFFWWWPFLQMWDNILLWFWLAFLWWLAILSMFSCASCPSVCVTSLEKCLFRSSACILTGLFFWHRVVWAVHIFWILIPYWSYHLGIFPPIQ